MHVECLPHEELIYVCIHISSMSYYSFNLYYIRFHNAELVAGARPDL